MTDERDQRNPWDPPAEGSQPEPPGPAAPEARPGDQPPYPPPAPGQPPPYGYGASPGGAYGQPVPYPPQPQYGQPPYGQQQYAQPQYGQPAPAYYGPPPTYGPTTAGKATTVLVLGILSLVMLFGCIGFILAIVALVMAPGARREIEESGGRLTGEGQIKAGKIMSWITLILTALGIVAAVVIAVVAISTDSTTSDSPATGVRTNATSVSADGF